MASNLEGITHLVFHHSASPLSTTVNEIRRWHLNRGWVDIGYHRVILANGSRVPGRPLLMAGAHARGHNRTSIGVCIVGDNTIEARRWTKHQWVAAREERDMWESLIPGIIVCGHRDLGAATECPGLDVNRWLRGD